MKITIDSSEPLPDVLRVIGALYDVDLSVSDRSDPDQEATLTRTVGPSGAKKAARPASGPRPRGAARAKKTAAVRSSAPVSTLELRSWARQNGFTVSERGRVATKVVAAYRAAHGS